MTILVEKVSETRLRWFEHVEKTLMASLIRRIYKMAGSQTARGRGSPRKTIRKRSRD